MRNETTIPEGNVTESEPVASIRSGKLLLCQQELEVFIKNKADYFSVGIIQEQKTLVSSRSQDPKVDFRSIAEDLKPMYEKIGKIGKKLGDLGPCFEISLKFAQRTILIRKMDEVPDGQPNSFWLLLSMKSSARNFSRDMDKMQRRAIETLFSSGKAPNQKLKRENVG